MDGTHQLNDGVHLQLICLETDATIPLKSFIGSQVDIDIVTDKAQLIRTTSFVPKQVFGLLLLKKIHVNTLIKVTYFQMYRVIGRCVLAV